MERGVNAEQFKIQKEALLIILTSQIGIGESVYKRGKTKSFCVESGWYALSESVCAIICNTAKPAGYSTRKLNYTCWFCRCETWFVTLREEYRVRVFQNTVLRKIFVPEREEITEDLRWPHELHDLHPWPYDTRADQMEDETGGQITCVKEMTYTYKVYR
jgi:hypothetical protein